MEKQDVEKEWLPEQYSSICPHCSRFVKFSMFKTHELVKHVLVFKDPGYGQEDEYADITYEVTYIVCPNCNKETEQTRAFVSEAHRHRLRD